MLSFVRRVGAYGAIVFFDFICVALVVSCCSYGGAKYSAGTSVNTGEYVVEFSLEQDLEVDEKVFLESELFFYAVDRQGDYIEMKCPQRGGAFMHCYTSRKKMHRLQSTYVNEDGTWPEKASVFLKKGKMYEVDVSRMEVVGMFGRARKEFDSFEDFCLEHKGRELHFYLFPFDKGRDIFIGSCMAGEFSKGERVRLKTLPRYKRKCIGLSIDP